MEDDIKTKNNVVSLLFIFRYSGLNSRIRTKTYEPLNNKGAPLPVKTFEEFRSTIVPMLLALGPYSSDDPVLLYKTLRILKSSLGIVCEFKFSFSVLSPSIL